MIVDKAGKLDELIDGAEDLLTKLADAHNPEIQYLRDRVDQAIRDARRQIARQGETASPQLREIVNIIDDYVRDYPWLALTTGMLVAGTVAYLAGAARGKVGPARDWF
jgi:ElaB/YqjD/DUF883 family membrane-anchored ribosome-binding protein